MIKCQVNRITVTLVELNHYVRLFYTLMQISMVGIYYTILISVFNFDSSVCAAENFNM